MLRWVSAAALCACALALARGGAPADACARLDAAYQRADDGKVRPDMLVSVYGKARYVSVRAAAAPPARAAAALLAAALRHGARLQQLHLLYAAAPAAPADELCELAETMQHDCPNIDQSDSIFDNLVLAPAVGWGEARCEALEVCRERPLVPLRLRALGPGAAPLQRRLHAALQPQHRRSTRCATVARWRFYRDRDALRDCGFVGNDKSNMSATMWYATNSAGVNDTVAELSRRVAAASLHISFNPLSSDENLHRQVLELVRSQNSSVLFLDYDIWQDEPGVQLVEPPPCLGEYCEPELDPLRSVRVADVHVLQQMAPQLLTIFRRFSPTPTQLRKILELEMERSNLTIEEAACEWAANNTSIFDSWFRVHTSLQYYIVVFLCVDDPDNAEYKRMAEIVAQYYCSKTTKFNITTYFVENDCSSESDLGNKLIKETVSSKWRRLVGVVAWGAGAAEAAEYAPTTGTALLLAGAPGAARLGPAVRAVGGSLSSLAHAITTFLYFFEWKRLAILSEETEIASDFIKALRHDNILAIRNFPLGTEIKPSSIKESLKSLKQADARIIFVNTISKNSKAILCFAQKLGMTHLNGYIWIVRDWNLYNLDCANSSLDTQEMSFFTISYWWRGQDTATYSTSNSNNNPLRNILNELWKDRLWPSLTVPIADALQLLIKSFEEFKERYASRLNDLHGHNTVGLLLETLEKHPHDGLIQELHYKNGVLANPLMFIYQWVGNHSNIIANWSIINGTIPDATILRDVIKFALPTDGARACLTTSTGDAFEPDCQDKVWLTSACCIFITCLLLCLSWRIRMRSLTHHDSILRAQLLAQREISSTVLVNHLVDRAALDIYHDLGKGCFGRVRYAILHAPGRVPMSVAVKELLDDVAPAEESELLREAATLAALRHEHVVRLVGVCTTGGPLLVLMEYAFFGNLQQYLNERRHLAEDAADRHCDASDEAYHVSAESITRLAREAVSALEYLALQKLVHRDVRASNCLVDERRALKLADFGLARATGAGAAGDEYSCRRRGLFPVLWMAPESLERGVFTPASDAWALGVLLLEVATLGARPYGSWSPERVMRYVCAGGRPPLPTDISPETRQLLLQCWRRGAAARLPAAGAARVLARRPALLRPALAPPAPVQHEDYPLPDDYDDAEIELLDVV